MPLEHDEFSNLNSTPPGVQIGKSRCAVFKYETFWQSSRYRQSSSFGIQFISILLPSTSLTIILKSRQRSLERSILLNYGLWLPLSLYYLLFYSISGIEESSWLLFNVILIYLLVLSLVVILIYLWTLNNLFLFLESGSNSNIYSTVPQNQAGNLVSDLIWTMVCGDLAVCKLSVRDKNVRAR